MTPVSTAEPSTDEKLYTLKEAAHRAGFRSPGALRTHLCRNPHLAERRYRGSGRNRQRFLTNAEIDRLRESLSS